MTAKAPLEVPLSTRTEEERVATRRENELAKMDMQKARLDRAFTKSKDSD